jgi:hypothetical protein
MRAVVVLNCLLILCCVGCGSASEKPVPAGGKVTLKGKPVEGAMVTFTNKKGGRSATGKTEADGSFKLSSINTNDGAVPGEFLVTISKQEAKGGGSADIDISKGYGENYGKMMGAAAGGSMAKVLTETIPAKYADPAQSGLAKSVVKGEENNFLFDL